MEWEDISDSEIKRLGTIAFFQLLYQRRTYGERKMRYRNKTITCIVTGESVHPYKKHSPNTLLRGIISDVKQSKDIDIHWINPPVTKKLFIKGYKFNFLKSSRCEITVTVDLDQVDKLQSEIKIFTKWINLILNHNKTGYIECTPNEHEETTSRLFKSLWANTIQFDNIPMDFSTIVKRLVGLWVWDKAIAFGHKHGRIQKAIDAFFDEYKEADLESLGIEDIDKVALRSYYGFTHKCIRTNTVCPFHRKPRSSK